MKDMCSYFSKILKKIEVGQLHALDDFLTGETAKTPKIRYEKNPEFTYIRSCPTSKFLNFYFLLHSV